MLTAEQIILPCASKEIAAIYSDEGCASLGLRLANGVKVLGAACHASDAATGGKLVGRQIDWKIPTSPCFDARETHTSRLGQVPFRLVVPIT